MRFEEDLALIFPTVKLELRFDAKIDQYIEVKSIEGERTVPLDLAGTGLLQAVQILAYLHLFAPKLIVLDEPDSHLHPNNQRLLCSLLTTIAWERDVQVIMTTHSRHVLDSMYNDARILWVQEGQVVKATAEDQVDILLELGALDVEEKIASGKFKAIVLTEDAVTQYLNIILRNSGFTPSDTTVLSYNGVTNVHLLKPLVKHIKKISNAVIVVHRDRDFLDNNEVEDWKKQIRAIEAEPFVTAEIDVEGYFCADDYLSFATKRHNIDIDELKAKAIAGAEDEIITSYVNGRVDHERKSGTIGKLDFGKLSAAAARTVMASPWSYMKGKRKLARVRFISQDVFGVRFDIDPDGTLPVDQELVQLARKHFKKITPAQLRRRPRALLA
jgi:ABC-type proline/glycine betaine transport system ATPase subunit